MFRQLASSMRFGRVASSVVGSVRNLNLHEYQSIGLLRTHGAKVQNGSVAHSKDTALEVANAILKSDSNADIIVKAQIHAGGRGKGTFTNGFQGGVQIVNSASKAANFAEKMIGNTLVTKQTGEQGQLCQSVLINQVGVIESRLRVAAKIIYLDNSQGINIIDEKYFAILLDRAHNGPVMVGSHRVSFLSHLYA
jgi:succinyl-CoA synthetase beta subunit